MLNHPFTDWDDLLSVDDQLYDSHTAAFRACKRSHSHLDDFYTDPEVKTDNSSETDEDTADEEDEDPPGEFPLADFEAWALLN